MPTPTPRDLVTPGQRQVPRFPPITQATGEPVTSRAAYQGRIRNSGLPPAVRLTALTLATYANSLGEIGDDRQPSFRTLRNATGLFHERLRHVLDHLEHGGWIARRADPAVPGRVLFALTCPAADDGPDPGPS